MEVKPQSQSTWFKGKKKIKNFNCPCIHSLQSENVFQFLYWLAFSLLFSLCINYDQVFIIWLDSFFLFKFLGYISDLGIWVRFGFVLGIWINWCVGIYLWYLVKNKAIDYSRKKNISQTNRAIGLLPYLGILEALAWISLRDVAMI